MKILISQTASLGDVILSTPLIAAIKQEYSEAEIWFLTSSGGAQLLKNDSRLSGLITFDKKGRDSGIYGLIKKATELRKLKFDKVYAIQRSARVSILLVLSGISERIGFSTSALPFLFSTTVKRMKGNHEVERNLSLLSGQIEIKEEHKDLRLFAPERQPSNAKYQELIKSGENIDVAIFPGSLWYTKRWKSQNYSALARKLIEAGIRPYFFGSSDEQSFVDQCAADSGCFSFAGRTNLQELLYIISNSKLVVCNDSSALHIAASFKIPTVAIFCATSPEMGFGPWRNPSCKVLGEDELWCRPCSRHGAKFCPTGTEVCMKGTSENSGAAVESAYRAVMAALKESR